MTNESTSGEMTQAQLPSFAEMEQLIKEAFPHTSTLCPVLCREYQAAVELLQDAPPKSRPAILARIRALINEMRQLHCPTCLLQ
jgi:hypothetical protein